MHTHLPRVIKHPDRPYVTGYVARPLLLRLASRAAALTATMLLAALPAAVLVTASAATSSSAVPELVEWAEYKQLFNRDYADDPAEEAHRREIFAANVEFIRAHNAEADAKRSSYRLGVNDFTDLENEEWARDYARSNAASWPSPPRSNNASADGGAVATLLHEPPPATRDPNATCSLYNYNLTQYAGGTVIGFTQEPDAAECCAACAKNPDCQNYNYKFGTGCTLYSKADTATKPGGPMDACGGRTDPNDLNWVTKGAVTSIKNQGQCGGCWAFAAVGATEGAWQIATGELISLSEQQVMDCSNQVRRTVVRQFSFLSGQNEDLLPRQARVSNTHGKFDV